MKWIYSISTPNCIGRIFSFAAALCALRTSTTECSAVYRAPLKSKATFIGPPLLLRARRTTSIHRRCSDGAMGDLPDNDASSLGLGSSARGGNPTAEGDEVLKAHIESFLKRQNMTAVLRFDIEGADHLRDALHVLESSGDWCRHSRAILCILKQREYVPSLPLTITHDDVKRVAAFQDCPVPVKQFSLFSHLLNGDHNMTLDRRDDGAVTMGGQWLNIYTRDTLPAVKDYFKQEHPFLKSSDPENPPCSYMYRNFGRRDYAGFHDAVLLHMGSGFGDKECHNVLGTGSKIPKKEETVSFRDQRIAELVAQMPPPWHRITMTCLCGEREDTEVKQLRRLYLCGDDPNDSFLTYLQCATRGVFQDAKMMYLNTFETPLPPPGGWELWPDWKPSRFPATVEVARREMGSDFDLIFGEKMRRAEARGE
mmetsp:Transcript_34041/g.84164  ORF Transcript_34041/g.84164 Transcript_34041/m.84164 type:complete len:425 (-) Transcript_34041:342-1616(-)